MPKTPTKSAAKPITKKTPAKTASKAKTPIKKISETKDVPQKLSPKIQESSDTGSAKVLKADEIVGG